MLESRPVIKLPPIPDEVKAGPMRLYFEQLHAVITKQVKNVFVDLYHNRVIAASIVDQGGLAVLDTVPAHDLGGAEHNADTLADLNAKVSDATLDDSSATRTPSAHDLAGAEHNADTIADLNTKLSDATLDDARGVYFAPVEDDTSVAVADGKVAFTVPLFMNGMNLIDVVASVHTKGITGTTDVQLRRRRAGADVDMLSTKITIADEYFATDEVIDTTKDDIATGDQIYIDVDAVHSGTAPLGLSVILTFRK